MLAANWTIITIDWKEEADRINYLRSAKAARSIARRGAQILRDATNNTKLNPMNIHLVGHSLGAQLMSFLAKDYQELS